MYLNIRLCSQIFLVDEGEKVMYIKNLNSQKHICHVPEFTRAKKTNKQWMDL